jgi:hypothetical protein
MIMCRSEQQFGISRLIACISSQRDSIKAWHGQYGPLRLAKETAYEPSISKAHISDPLAQRTQASHPWLSEVGPYRHVRLCLCLSTSSIASCLACSTSFIQHYL